MDTGPAILISALTNITADAVGCYTGSPEITLLCIGNIAAMFFDFIYQVTLFTSVMALAGHFEMESENVTARYSLSIEVNKIGNGMNIVPSKNARKKVYKFYIAKNIILFSKHMHNILESTND
jgi:hypothetical protein